MSSLTQQSLQIGQNLGPKKSHQRYDMVHLIVKKTAVFDHCVMKHIIQQRQKGSPSKRKSLASKNYSKNEFICSWML